MAFILGHSKHLVKGTVESCVTHDVMKSGKSVLATFCYMLK